MLTEGNKALIRRGFEEGINGGNDAVFDETISPNYVNHDMPTPALGAEGFKQVIGMFRAAFPDLRVAVEDVLGEGDRVATRGTMSGTHLGGFMGVPSTGRPVEVPYIDVWRVEGDRAAENWVQMDMLGMMQQLGVIPPAEVPGPEGRSAADRREDGDPEENKATLRRALENWNRGDLAGYAELYSPGVVLHGYQGVEPGMEGTKRFYEAFWAAFPGSRITIEDMFGEGDEVACRFTLRATHEGEFNGIPPTGRQVTVPGITILRFASGRCVERWSQSDFMGMLQQLGVVPAPEQSGRRTSDREVKTKKGTSA